jgi:hypothetical protein
VSVLWFVIWLIADLTGHKQPLKLDPVSWWTATLILAVALDLNRPSFDRRPK